VFHVELRRFPNVARAFNLSEQELDARIVLPFARGEAIEFDDRTWPADRKTRLTVYEGPPVGNEERGLGRGWSLVTRDGDDVTPKVLDAARKRVREASPGGAPPGLKHELVEAAGSPDGISPADAVALAARGRLGQRASEALAVAEQAVWELLHEGGLTLWRAQSAEPVAPEEWQALLLAWETWREEGGLRLSAAE
jgi:hypothetical protein